MPRIAPIEYSDASPEVRAAHDDHVRDHARITNMKRTLLNSLPAFQALMEWYPLRDTVQPFLGERLTVLFAHAISAETDCLICSTFFRRILIDAGEDPDRLVLDDREPPWSSSAVVSPCRRFRCRPRSTTASPRTSTPAQMTALTAFGAIMVATNVFNNALEVELDEYLHPYRRQPAASHHDG